MTNPTKNPDELAVPLGLLLTNSTRGIAVHLHNGGHIDLVTNAASCR